MTTVKHINHVAFDQLTALEEEEVAKLKPGTVIYLRVDKALASLALECARDMEEDKDGPNRQWLKTMRDNMKSMGGAFLHPVVFTEYNKHYHYVAVVSLNLHERYQTLLGVIDVFENKRDEIVGGIIMPKLDATCVDFVPGRFMVRR